MPKPQHRSRKLRRITKRLPGGRKTTHYAARKSSRPRCGSCGTILQGMSSSITKTLKRPQRPYGGMLCFNCLQKMMGEKAQTFAQENKHV